MNQCKEVSFLFDSGSDLSLICTDKVDKKLLNNQSKPRSIQGTLLTYHGFLEFDVCIGNKTVRNQRFHIVDNLVCPFVAGIDLIQVSVLCTLSGELEQSTYGRGGGLPVVPPV